MRAIVINTGSELLLGNVLNTHLRFIAREIFPLGLRVAKQLTVPDGPAIREAMESAFAEAEIVFVTGGLGPTTDDITRETAAELLGLDLYEDAETAAAITNRLRARGFPLTDRVLRQAQVPAGGTVLPNANGTAPGLYLRPQEVGGRRPTPHLFLLPGPPRELYPMFRDFVLPLLRDIVPARNGSACRTLRLACVGESVVEAKVGAQLLALPDVELGYCAHAGAVDVRVIGPEASIAEAEALVRAAMGESLFSTSDEELEAVVLRLLTERRKTVAVAESCTGGYIAHRLTNVPGASAVFLAGYVTYANDAKTAALGVSPDLLRAHGAVSAPVAAAMAESAVTRSRADFALATTGIAGPGGGSVEKPVGTVEIALAQAGAATQTRRFCFMTDRETFKQLASQHALEMLRQELLRA
jgi:nicotinamide-nucleotide amidase